MKKILIGLCCTLFIVISCSKGSESTEDGTNNNLITPRVSAQVSNPLNEDPFTGILEIYPCNSGTSTYYGNYINGKISIFNGYYTIVQGDVFGQNNRELHLPFGFYNMVYWGTPKYDEPIYNAPAIRSPGITRGADLSQLYFSLRESSDNDGTYLPVYDLVYSVHETQIGKENIYASLRRVGSGIKVIVRQEDNGTFSDNIAGITVYIGSIAEKLNFFTAVAENMTKTVKFDLTRSDDATVMSNATVMLFPSGPNPLLELVVTLADGTERKLSQPLNSTLSPNTLLTLNVVLGKILPGGNPGDFTIEDWNETSETIEFPIID